MAVKWDESDFLERLVPHMKQTRDPEEDTCPDAAALCSLIDDPKGCLNRQAIAAHISRCAACAGLYGRLQQFARTETPEHDPDWGNAERRLDLWMEGFLRQQTATRPLGQESDRPSTTLGWSRMGDWLRGSTAKWVLGTTVSLAGVAGIAFLLVNGVPLERGKQIAALTPQPTQQLQPAGRPASTTAAPAGDATPALVVSPPPAQSAASPGNGSRTGPPTALPTVVAVAGAGSSAQGQYLIEHMDGGWEVRAKGQKERPVGDRFDVITTADQVRCVKAPCVLEYSTEGSPKPLFASTAAPSGWMTVPPPTGSPVVQTAVGMQQLVSRTDASAVAEKGDTACSGDLQLLAPRCREMLDTLDVRLRWTPRPADAGKTYTLLVGATDSSERRRWNGIKADDGEFASGTLQEYLASLQRPNRAVDITLRLMRTENLDAIRYVRIQSTADEAEHRRVLQQLGSLAELPRLLGSLQEFLKMGMWSRAADVSRTLLETAPSSVELQKYALVGLCGSDFVDDIAKLRRSLRAAGVSGLCEPAGGVR